MPGYKITGYRVDYSDLLDLMKKQRLTRTALSRAMPEVNYQSLWRKVKNGDALDGRIVMVFCKALCIKHEEIGRYFFTEKKKRKAA